MEYRRFGRTDFQIPVISCGGMRYQESWKDDDPVSDESQKNLEACIRKALDLGINHIETARGYGTSEYQLGKICVTPHLQMQESPHRHHLFYEHLSLEGNFSAFNTNI